LADLRACDNRRMRVAALYDVHGNLPALDVVLAEVAREAVDLVLVGGDVMPGPMPRQVLERLQSLGVRTEFIRGNGDRECLAEVEGRVSPMPESLRRLLRWSRAQLTPEQLTAVSAWPETFRQDVPGLGSVLFCHATPRNDEEIVTRLMSDDVLRPILDGVANVVVCGHTHMQFDRVVGTTRVVNAGSVGMPFEQPAGAYWLRLGPGVELRRTAYDVAAAAEAVRGTAYPSAEEFARVNVLQPPDMLDALTKYGLVQLGGVTNGA
jgi:putative phosphoesterase